VIAVSEHGDRFVAAVARDNVAGMQFHPEKSQANGIRLLGDFLEWRP
jgi:glutamine amidotransferase